ncbi:MAG: hypothetical protein HQL66_00630 [Magnetococcales bacterium]|nr:hypothetical protein [Magnetococcales bacterium]
MTDAIDLSALPERLRELVELIGVDATLVLAQEWGGSCLPSLRQLPPDHPLMVRLGPEVVGKLADYFGSEWPYIPSGAAHLRRLRDREIRAVYDAGGISADGLARRYRLSNRQVWNILSQVDTPVPRRRRYEDPRQLKLTFES